MLHGNYLTGSSALCPDFFDRHAVPAPEGAGRTGGTAEPAGPGRCGPAAGQPGPEGDPVHERGQRPAGHGEPVPGVHAVPGPGCGRPEKGADQCEEPGHLGRNAAGEPAGGHAGPGAVRHQCGHQTPQPGTGGIRHPAARAHRGCPGVAAHRRKIPSGGLPAAGPGPGRRGQGWRDPGPETA